MPSPILQFKRGAVSALPGLRAGEPALTTDTFDLYVGINSTTEENKFFGSHRYWTKETATTGSGVRFVERTDGGSDYIELKAPNTALAGITTYTLPATPTAGYFLKTNALGDLEWASVTGSATFENATLTGITTITNAQIQSGSINSTTIGLTTAAAGTFTQLNYDNSSTSGISTVGELFVGTTQVLYDDGGLITLAGIQTVDATTIATLEALLSLDPNDFDTLNVAGIGTFGGLLDANAGLDVTGHTELDDLNVTGFSTFTNAIDADLLGNAGTATSLATGRNIAVSGIVTGTAYFDGTADITIATTIQDNVIGLGTHTYGDYVKDVSGTANQISVSGTGEGASVVVSLPNDVVVGTSLSVTTLKTATIQHSNGTEALTIDTFGNVGVSTNLTVNGNLYVTGTTTEVNSTALTVEDRTIDLGIVNGTAPASATTWDLGILFNYFTDAAKKSAVVWEHADTRFKFASVIGADTDGTTVDTPQLTVTTFAPIEIGSLWVTDCAGTSQVISCADGVRNLENITIDAGVFV